ncbi:mitochondrial fission ELM1 family protein [Hyphomonas sp. FCG-A18]|uniref:mitochondrial fission ELM1 family protein n=1 Tax=Hyphomonas sp. FCG-A18 TaxID=3080019 RepID=UPI002B2F0A03|nr:mitochondrial fission ELM1 family protein [Hyphomonas sp. FCG-A18]
MISEGPSIWSVSDGRAGNAAQVRAIVAALHAPDRWGNLAHINGNAHHAEPITLTPRAPWTWLPGTSWPFAKAALPEDQKALLTPPWPNLWIAAGRRSAPYTRYVKQQSQGKTLTIQILDPKSDLSTFDLIITPEHDSLSGPNVITTIGSPSHFSATAIAQARADFSQLAGQSSKNVIIILGGDSKTHRFTDSAADRLIAQLRALAAQGWYLRITTSRRTPESVAQKMRALAGELGGDFWATPKDGPNPYLGWLLHAQAAIVTEDSANMLCDAAWHGLPVHMAKLEGRAPKFDRLHQSLIDRGCARWFEGELESWSYEPLREADRVADIIVEKLLERFPA